MPKIGEVTQNPVFQADEAKSGDENFSWVYSILMSLDRMKRPVPARLVEKVHKLMDG
jgi:hypothetical protein